MSLRHCLATVLIVLGLSACGHSGPATPDARTPGYVALVQGVFERYNAARGDGYFVCVESVDPPPCHDRGVAMIAVWMQFLDDLNHTPPPPRFAADDRAIRSHLPKGVDDLRAMVAAAAGNDPSAVLSAAQSYVGDMPSVTDALGDVYAPWRTN